MWMALSLRILPMENLCRPNVSHTMLRKRHLGLRQVGDVIMYFVNTSNSSVLASLESPRTSSSQRSSSKDDYSTEDGETGTNDSAGISAIWPLISL